MKQQMGRAEGAFRDSAAIPLFVAIFPLQAPL
jgi:hypothetical protein